MWPRFGVTAREQDFNAWWVLKTWPHITRLRDNVHLKVNSGRFSVRMLYSKMATSPGDRDSRHPCRQCSDLNHHQAIFCGLGRVALLQHDRHRWSIKPKLPPLAEAPRPRLSIPHSQTDGSRKEKTLIRHQRYFHTSKTLISNQSSMHYSRRNRRDFDTGGRPYIWSPC